MAKRLFLILVGLVFNLKAATVIFLIDESGSMKYNDPQKLSIKSISLYGSLFKFLSPQSEDLEISIIGFADSARIVVPLQPYKPYLDTLINSSIRRDGKHTDIAAALKAALGLIDSLPIKRDISVVLLTDGKIELPAWRSMSAYHHELDSILTVFGNLNIPVTAIGLSKQADRQLLKRISAKTGGQYQIVEKAPELVQTFSNLLVSTTGSMSRELSLAFMTMDRFKKANFFIPRYTPQFIISIIKPRKKTDFRIYLVASDTDTIMCGSSQDCIMESTTNSIILRKHNPNPGLWQLVLKFKDESAAKGNEIKAFLYLQPVRVLIKSPDERGVPLFDSVYFHIKLQNVSPTNRGVNFDNFIVKIYIEEPSGETESFKLKRRGYNYMGFSSPLKNEGFYTYEVIVEDTLSKTRYAVRRGFSVLPVPDLKLEFKQIGLPGKEAIITLKPDTNIPTQVESLMLDSTIYRIWVEGPQVDTAFYPVTLKAPRLEAVDLHVPMPSNADKSYKVIISAQMAIRYRDVTWQIVRGTYTRKKIIPLVIAFKLKGISGKNFLVWGNVGNIIRTHKIKLKPLLGDKLCLRVKKILIYNPEGLQDSIIPSPKETKELCAENYSTISIPIKLPVLPEGNYTVRAIMSVGELNAPLVISYSFKKQSPLVVLLSLMGFFLIAGGILYMYKRITRPKFKGKLVYENIPYDLSRYRKSEIYIGTQGDIKIDSPEIKSKHAKLVATDDGVKIFSFEGPVEVDDELLEGQDYGVVLRHQAEIKLSPNVVLYYESEDLMENKDELEDFDYSENL